MNLLSSALLLNQRFRLSEGGICWFTIGELATIILGGQAIGSIYDPVGNLIFKDGTIDTTHYWVVESPAPGIIDRCFINEPLLSGVLTIDSAIPIGKGQRELIVGDRITGKTSIGV